MHASTYVLSIKARFLSLTAMFPVTILWKAEEILDLLYCRLSLRAFSIDKSAIFRHVGSVLKFSAVVRTHETISTQTEMRSETVKNGFAREDSTQT